MITSRPKQGALYEPEPLAYMGSRAPLCVLVAKARWDGLHCPIGSRGCHPCRRQSGPKSCHCRRQNDPKSCHCRRQSDLHLTSRYHCRCRKSLRPTSRWGCHCRKSLHPTSRCRYRCRKSLRRTKIRWRNHRQMSLRRTKIRWKSRRRWMNLHRTTRSMCWQRTILSCQMIPSCRKTILSCRRMSLSRSWMAEKHLTTRNLHASCLL